MSMSDTQKNDMAALIEMSKSYGMDEDMLQAGGGNTSLKSESYMWVKASGVAMKNVRSAEDFVRIDISAIETIPSEDVLEDLKDEERQEIIDKRIGGGIDPSCNKRPSIETLLHVLIKDKFVAHLHPVYVNALACMDGGYALACDLLGQSEFVWLPFGKPGYQVARSLYLAFRAHSEQYGATPKLVIMANHGSIVSDENTAKLIEANHRIATKLADYFGPHDEGSTIAVHRGGKAKEIESRIIPALKHHNDTVVSEWSKCGFVNKLAAGDDFASVALSGALYPDHIVYCGLKPLVMSDGMPESEIANAIEKFVSARSYLPRYIVVPGCGVMVTGGTKAEALMREEMLRVHVKILTLILKKHRPVFLSDEDCEFLDSWEAEKYRQCMLSGDNQVPKVNG